MINIYTNFTLYKLDFLYFISERGNQIFAKDQKWAKYSTELCKLGTGIQSIFM